MGIDPSASEHATSKIDTVQNIGLRHGDRINAHRGQGLDTRVATAQLPYLDIVREVVIAVLPAMLDAFVVQDPCIVVEPDAGPFVVVDQSSLPTDTLDEPDGGGVRYAQIPGSMARTSVSILIGRMRPSASMVRISSA